jgi:hypothetical protein
MKQKEHITDMPHCWCNPSKTVFKNGTMHIVHNEVENTMKDTKYCKYKNCKAEKVKSDSPIYCPKHKNYEENNKL